MIFLCLDSHMPMLFITLLLSWLFYLHHITLGEAVLVFISLVDVPNWNGHDFQKFHIKTVRVWEVRDRLSASLLLNQPLCPLFFSLLSFYAGGKAQEKGQQHYGIRWQYVVFLRDEEQNLSAMFLWFLESWVQSYHRLLIWV